MRVPPELDSLMWAIAEENNPNAAAEFIQRYPSYREELRHRQDAVTSLRTSKPFAASTLGADQLRPIPKFIPRKVRRFAPEPRQVGIAAFLALAAIAAASYTITTWLAPKPPLEIPPPPQVETGPVTMHNPPVIQHESPPPIVNPPPRANPEPDRPPVTPKYEQPTQLVMKEAPLKSVLQTLGFQTGLRVVLGPGMPNPTIAVRYDDMLPIEIYKDLGKQYGFTAFDQGDGSVLVIPAVDTRPSPPGAATPIRRIGG